MLKYLVPFLEAFFFTILIILSLLPLAKKIHWGEREAKRHIHKKNTYRIGGIAMVLAFILAVLLNKDLVITPELTGFLLASVLLMFVGMRDDMKEIFWKTQLFFQMASAIFVFIVGVRVYYITNPLTGGVINLDLSGTVLISLAVVVFWIVFVINAINWIDGVDGLSGGISLISVGTIFILSFRPEVNQPPVAIISSIIFGVILGFLIFNFNPARIMAGTSGAMFMGLALAILAIFSGTKIATAVLVLVIPIVDFIWVISDRMKNKQSIFKPDNNHLHHKLLEIGWSQKKIALHYYTITIIIALIALNTRTVGKSIIMLVAILIMLFIFWVIDRRLESLR
ncbi:MAG: MraY family glycosyltransferase [Candidatus Moraniibacteriota bacterium]